MGAYRVFKAGSVPHHGMENLPKPDFAGIRTRAWRAIYPTQAKGGLNGAPKLCCRSFRRSARGTFAAPNDRKQVGPFCRAVAPY